MPRYQYTCPHEHVTERIVPVAKYKEWIRCKHNLGSDDLVIPCGAKAIITIDTNLQVNTFKPYIEPNFGPEPILIESKQQRDALCDKHGTTYDSCRYVSKKTAPSAVDTVDFGLVKKTIEEGKTPDGEKIQGPIKLSEKEIKRCAQIKIGGNQNP